MKQWNISLVSKIIKFNISKGLLLWGVLFYSVSFPRCVVPCMCVCVLPSSSSPLCEVLRQNEKRQRIIQQEVNYLPQPAQMNPPIFRGSILFECQKPRARLRYQQTKVLVFQQLISCLALSNAILLFKYIKIYRIIRGRS